VDIRIRKKNKEVFMDKTKIKNCENIVARMVLGDHGNYYSENVMHNVARAAVLQNDAIKKFASCFKSYKETYDENGVNVLIRIAKNYRFDISKLSDVQKEDYRSVLIDLINYTTLVLIELEDSM
jgi:hypothetical protein